jgi:hypothetical protein
MKRAARAVSLLCAGLTATGCASLATSAAECFRTVPSTPGSFSPESVLTSLRLESAPADSTGVAFVVAPKSRWQARWWRYGDSLRVESETAFNTYWLRLQRTDSAVSGRVGVTTDVVTRDSAGVSRRAEYHWPWTASRIECSRLSSGGRLPQN